MNRILEDKKKVKSLAEKLNRFNLISKYDSNGEQEAWRLVHSLSDLEQSFREIIDILLPNLCETKDEETCNNILLDIGEELRHILYHIKDPQFFRFLIEDGE